MKRIPITLLFLLALAPEVVSSERGRIHGRLLTKEGAVWEGLIRWDKNEANWLDILDGSKEIPERNRKAAERAGLLEEHRSREVSLLGFKIFELESGGEFPSAVQSGVRFGHIRTLEPMGNSRARLLLRSGEEVVLFGSSDIGTSVRKITVEDPEKGERSFDWGDVERIDFGDPKETPNTPVSAFGERLYGTLTTESGPGFTGYVCWDMDELFETDVVDGKEGDQDRKVDFGQVAAIERKDALSARLLLKNGETVVLSGTNDVNEDNRGILILDPGLGQVRVGWGQFKKLTFSRPPEAVESHFGGGYPLAGLVVTEAGDTHQGKIRWDNDEEFSWELLDGSCGGLEFDIELEQVSSIRKVSSQKVVVILRDERTFELEGSNDVGEGNKGVFVTTEGGREIAVPWEDFSRIEFKPGS